MRMRRRPGAGWIAVLRGSGLIAVVIVSASTGIGVGFQYREAARAQRIVELKPELDAWRAHFDADTVRSARGREAAERWLDAAALELSAMQGRIVHLEALARRLVVRTNLENEAFDFDDEPGVGGPEETLFESHGALAHWERAARGLAVQVEDRWLQMQILEEVLKWRELDAAVRPEGRPVGPAYVSSNFGARIDPFTGRQALHRGIDFAGRPGTEIIAVAAGIVTWSGPRSGYGQTVEIDHGNALITRYAHNAENLVDAGDVVIRGQPIAKLGATGRATGPNLHFEVLQNGEAINPLPFID